MSSQKPMILLVEGKRAEDPTLITGLSKKGYQLETVTSGAAAVARLKKGLPNLVLVNAASMRTSGKRICQSLRTAAPGLPVVLILEENAQVGEKVDVDVVLTLPFTLQKLLNRIRPLLPVEEKKLVSAGPLKLDVEQRRVRIHGKQISLTPRLVSLLRVLMDRHGEVIDREELFRLVWETSYIGDTRTLDVHVSWLRQALEADPRHPQFIKTVRGIGYRLDVDTYVPPRSRKKLEKTDPGFVPAPPPEPEKDTEPPA